MLKNKLKETNYLYFRIYYYYLTDFQNFKSVIAQIRHDNIFLLNSHYANKIKYYALFVFEIFFIFRIFYYK